jgi:AcrR family transcriptional regulator
MATSSTRRAPVPDRPRRTSTPPQAEIVAAALAFIDAKGLEAFSLNALAAELGMFQPNMYRRFANRQQLLDLVVDEIMREAGSPDVDPADGRGWLLDWGARVRRAWVSHPRAAALSHHGGEASREAMDRVLGVLLTAFPADVAVVAGKAYLSQVFGAALLEARGQAASAADAPAPVTSEYSHVLEFARLEEQRATTQDAEHDFVQGLGILLDGFAAR